jgi:hypothetical protein
MKYVLFFYCDKRRFIIKKLYGANFILFSIIYENNQ